MQKRDYINLENSKIPVYIKEVDKNIATFPDEKYQKLDFSKIKFDEKIVISTEEALKDVTPINWSEDVLSGKRKIIVKGIDE